MYKQQDAPDIKNPIRKRRKQIKTSKREKSIIENESIALPENPQKDIGNLSEYTYKNLPSSARHDLGTRS